MATSRVTVVNYGGSNIGKLLNALDSCGARVDLTDDARTIAKSDRLLLPGVASFGFTMEKMLESGLKEALLEFIRTERPFLGICAGMQVLFDSSEEFGTTLGLGVLSGSVVALPDTSNGGFLRVPHTGWNYLVKPDSVSQADNFLGSLSNEKVAVYFSHSYHAVPSNAAERWADCIYGDIRICAAVRKDNIFALQFHPEQSGTTGLKILQSLVDV